MNEASLKFWVGLFVIAAILLLGFLIFLNSEGLQPRYTIFLKPSTAPGVTLGTPVRKNGILIGRVASVTTEDDHVVIEIDINEGERIYSSETLSIGADSFLGDAAIEILPLPKKERGDLVKAGDVMTTYAVKRNPLEIVDVALNLEEEIVETLAAVRQAGAAVEDAGNGINSLTGTVQSAFQDENSDFKMLVADVQLMSRKAQVALDNFNRIFENVNNVVGDPELKTRIRDLVATLPKLFEEVRVTITDTRETINSFRDISEGASRNLRNLEPFTESLSSEGPEILAQVNERLQSVDGLLDKIGNFADTLSQTTENIADSKGTVGKLLNDPALYNSTLETVNNAKETMERVRTLSTKLEPLVNDLRLFADSLARDPGQLGVRGALNRRPQGTGYKGTAGRFGERAPAGTETILR